MTTKTLVGTVPGVTGTWREAVIKEGWQIDLANVPTRPAQPNDSHGHRMGISAVELYRKHGLGEPPVTRYTGVQLKAVGQRLGGDDDDHGHLIMHEVRKNGIIDPNKWDFGVMKMAEAWAVAWGWKSRLTEPVDEGYEGRQR